MRGQADKLKQATKNPATFRSGVGVCGPDFGSSGHIQQLRSGLKNKRERAKERYDYENKREDTHVCERLNGEFSRRSGVHAVHDQIAPTQIDAQLVDERNEKSRKRSK